MWENFPTGLPKSRQQTRLRVICSLQVGLMVGRPRAICHENFQPILPSWANAGPVVELLPGLQAASDGVLRFCSFSPATSRLGTSRYASLSSACLVWRLTAVREKIFSPAPRN
jgi:hypothetical protein